MRIINQYKIIILISIVLIVLMLLSGCNLLYPKIEGIVIDSNSGAIVPNPQIKVLNVKLYHVSIKKNGTFFIYIFSLNKPKYINISIRKPGYEIRIIKVFIKSNAIERLTIEIGDDSSGILKMCS
jgi:LEA14-like dessication related protein